MIIVKYELGMHVTTELELPAGAEVVHVDEQHYRICMWVLADPQREKERRQFVVAPTGQTIPADAAHRGTVLVLDGALVWHVVELQPRHAEPVEVRT